MADRPSYPGIPRWLKVSGIVIIVLVLLVVVIVRFTGIGGPHGPEQFGPGQHAPGSDSKGNTPPIDGAPELAVTADELAFNPDRIELTAGKPINIVLTSTDILHDLVVDNIDFNLAADRDETVIGGMVFDEPGTYVGYCSVERHREELEIIVTPSAGS